MSTTKISHDVTRPPQSYTPSQDIYVHSRYAEGKRLQHTTTYFPGAHNFAIHGGEFIHVEGDQYISHHRNEDTSILLTIQEKLPYTPHACFDSDMGLKLSRKVCAKDTRVKVLAEIEKWATISGPESVLGYWMCGMAGTGKSTIAMSTCQALKDRGILAGSFFCSRQIPECRDYSLVIPTLAYQLAIFSEVFAEALKGLLGKNPDLGTKQPDIQLEELLINPWNAVTESGGLKDMSVMVIDALDECQNISLILKPLVYAIQKEKLPGLKFFLTSRPEQEIQLTLYSSLSDTLPVQKVQQFILHNVQKNLVQQDIYTYIKTELDSISPTEEQLQILAHLSQTLFIYAATVVKSIKGSRSYTRQRKRLADSLKLIYPADIRLLYEDIMNIVISAKELSQMEMEQDWMIVHTIISTGRPITCNAVAELLSVDVDIVSDLIGRLSAVCYIENECIFTFHASFPDFILSHESASGVSYNLKTQHLNLACACFRIMRQLRFNICSLPSSFIPDQRVPDLAQRIHENMSEALRYSCEFWDYHFIQCEIDKSLIQQLQVLLKQKGIYWIEAMSLQRLLSQCGQAMESILMISSECEGMSELIPIMRYLRTVLFRFASNEELRGTTPHLYLSILPLSYNSVGCDPEVRNCVKIQSHSQIQPMHDPLLKELKGHQGRVHSAAFSPDGTRIASGSFDNTVTIWDVTTGTQIGNPLCHDDFVRSVAFSRDGTRIASGSGDGTVRIWHATTGTQIGGTLNGHIGRVNSVAFSPDGTRIVSGSWDKTVRIWDATSGTQLSNLLHGHDFSVNSVAFSPDGTKIVYGAADGAVGVWDVTTETQVSNLLHGHTRSVTSVMFSPDGSRIVSGSGDKTVRIWDATIGTQMGSTLHGHDDWVNSVAFSPDGTRIASGSDDKTVRLWDATSGTQIGDPLHSHDDWINSVAFSPDGTRIVSGSDDKTVRIWDATIGIQICQSGSENHIVGHWDGSDEIPKVHSFNSVAFAPDGTRIVSGSGDGTVRVWDATTGIQIGDHLLGHTQAVTSVAFSPDGTRIVSGSEDKHIRVWDATAGAQIGSSLYGHTQSVISVTFSPDGTRIISGSEDSTVRIWDATTGNQIGSPLDGPVISMAFSPDGTKIVSVSGATTVRIWDAITGTQIGNPWYAHCYWANSVAFSTDGTRIASGSSDRNVRIWDATTETQIGDPLVGHDHIVTSVAFSQDGTRIVSGSEDKILRVWDVTTGAQIGGPLHGHDHRVNSVAFSPDGTRIVSGSFDGTIRIWNATSFTLAQPPLVQCNWTLSADGWIKTPDNKNIVWLPPYSRELLCIPPNICIISKKGYTKVPGDIAYGENWMHCVHD